jgi:hypothetical protein
MDDHDRERRRLRRENKKLHKLGFGVHHSGKRDKNNTVLHQEYLEANDNGK